MGAYKDLLGKVTDAAVTILDDDPTLSVEELHDALAGQENSEGVVLDAGDFPATWGEIAESTPGLTELVNMAVARVLTGRS